MAKRFTLGTAGIAIAVSLMGTAHAQDASDVYGPSIAEDANRGQAVTSGGAESEDEADADEREQDAAARREAGAYPTELVAQDMEMSLISRQITVLPSVTNAAIPLQTAAFDGAPLSTGVVTPQSVHALYGDIDPFYGNINPFYGNIGAFWGNINPFYGNISPFWGNINPFYGNISPFYGNIGAFWGDINAFGGSLATFTSENLGNVAGFGISLGAHYQQFEAMSQTLATDPALLSAYSASVRTRIEDMAAQARLVVGQSYTARTGGNLDSLINQILARNGIDRNNYASFFSLTIAQRAAFYLDWQDSILQYGGFDQVDHWMAAINWNPSITQIQGNGSQTIIGIVDGNFSSDPTLARNIAWRGGNSDALMGHGSAVTSLIAAPHDRMGTMGIAPGVRIATYNPFDTTGTASWDDVRRAIVALENEAFVGGNQTGYVSIINLSLGERGWTLAQGLADILRDPSIAPWNSETLFVVAAGNDGISQTTNINWSYTNEASLILVGSISPTGEISSFSNRPGTACLLNNGVCQAGSELFRRFVVAPGELLLVSDGQGGVTRVSGTSFAAPLVSGAISLMHDRWPWLVRHSRATADIIFRSARDLGAPGPDPVYGWGLLDVTASQSPLDFNTMTFNSYTRNRRGPFVKQSVSASSLLGAVPASWETGGVYFTMFENIGDTFRDFVVPMSSIQYGTTTNALGRTERMQDFISQRFANWITSGGIDRNGDGKAGFSEVRSNGGELAGEWSLRYDAIVPTTSMQGVWRPTHGAATLTGPNGTMAFTAGFGQGAMALGGYRFGIMSDHDPFTGGVNPVLGFASGQGFAAVNFQVAKGTKVKVGFTENRERWDEIEGATPEQLLTRRMLGDRPARAFSLDVEQQVSDKLSLGVNYTRLNETNALLGTQTSINALLGNGSHTEAMTVSASFDAGKGFSFDLSATGGRTRTDSGQLLANAGNILSTAGQFTATKRGVLNGKDSLRLSVAQPLQIERGALELRADEVIDRETGEIGQVVQTFSINTKRRVTGEAVYALPLTNSSELGVFGRYVSAGNVTQDESYVVGGSFSLRF